MLTSARTEVKAQPPAAGTRQAVLAVLGFLVFAAAVALVLSLF